MNNINPYRLFLLISMAALFQACDAFDVLQAKQAEFHFYDSFETTSSQDSAAAYARITLDSTNTPGLSSLQPDELISVRCERWSLRKIPSMDPPRESFRLLIQLDQQNIYEQLLSTQDINQNSIDISDDLSDQLSTVLKNQIMTGTTPVFTLRAFDTQGAKLKAIQIDHQMTLSVSSVQCQDVPLGSELPDCQ